jgi:hypothetical protein
MKCKHKPTIDTTKLSLGSRVKIDDIVMTVTEIKDTFGGKIYSHCYFANADLKFVSFHSGELEALGAEKAEEGRK